MATIEVVHKTGYGYDLVIYIEEYNYTTEAWEAADISGFSINSITFTIEKPQGDAVTVQPQFITDGSDGGLHRTILQGDNVFTERGSYQVDVNFREAGQNFYSTKYRFPVDNPLEPVP